MATIERDFLQSQLLERRQRLEAAVTHAPQDAALVHLLGQVDAALTRFEKGTYGICETCHEPIEENRLRADPLIRYCLDHLPAAQKRALEQDLELAAKIQRGLLPPQGMRWAGWEMNYHYEPAGPVSGDYCDLIPGAEEGSAPLFVLADVSGKGVAASMLMTQLHAMFRSLMGMGLPFGKVVEQANRLFSENTPAGQYATLVCGAAGPDGTVELFGAGHCPALVAGRNGVQQVESLGMPLGVFSTLACACRTIHPEVGDTLFLFTDGASEMCNVAQDEYGIERLTQVVGENRSLGPQALIEACLADLRRFAGGAPRRDDLSLMVLRRTG